MLFLVAIYFLELEQNGDFLMVPCDPEGDHSAITTEKWQPHLSQTPGGNWPVSVVPGQSADYVTEIKDEGGGPHIRF